jgi:hypothetical protein
VQLILVDRRGAVRDTIGQSRTELGHLSLSPDGRQVSATSNKR